MAVHQHTTDNNLAMGANNPQSDDDLFTIKFDGHYSGVLDIGKGSTAWSYIPVICALAHTRNAYVGNGGGHFRTDAEGLKRLISIAQYTEDALGDVVELIGDLMAHCDIDDLNTATMPNIGWLLQGLADIRRVVANTRADAAYYLRKEGIAE